MSIKYSFVIQQVTDIYMAVAVGEGAKKFKGMLKFNEIGKDIFVKIQERKSFDEIVDAMLNEYDATREQMVPEVQKIVDKLKSENLLED